MGQLICRFFSITVLFSICGWESVDEEGRLHTFNYTILYRAREHPQILVFVVWNQAPVDTEGKFKILGNQKLYVDFFIEVGGEG